VQAPTNNDHFGPSRKTTDGAIQFDAANTAYRILRLKYHINNITTDYIKQCTKYMSNNCNSL